MNNYKISEMISEEKVEARIKEIAEQINQDFAGESVTLVCILKGSIFFTTELAKYITLPVTIDFMQCSSYGADTTTLNLSSMGSDGVEEACRKLAMMNNLTDVTLGSSLSFADVDTLQTAVPHIRFHRSGNVVSHKVEVVRNTVHVD